MKALGTNADNDLYLEAGNLAILHDADAQCAVIEAILQTQQGELQFDPDRGIDYFGTVLQNPKYIDFWAAQVQSRIEDLDFVASVDDFTYRFDRETSTLYWSMTVTNRDDDRLDLRNKKTVIDGSPGLDVSWDDIYDKPAGVQQALDMVESMHEEAVDTREKLTSASTLRDTKELLNRIVFDPNDEEYSKTRQVSFEFSGVPLGIVIDLSRVRVDIENTGTTAKPYYAPFIVEISDGHKVRSDQTIAKWEEQTKEKEGKGNKILFLDEEKNATKDKDDETIYTTPRHTLMAGGSITLTIKGNIKKIWSAREVSDTEDVEDVEDAELPIFIHTRKEDGRVIVEPFQYLTGFTVGERVPLAAIGKGSFRDFGNLQKIVWKGANEESIILDDYAFAGCFSLMEIAWLPKNTTSLGIGCFQNCKSLLSLKGLESTQIERIPDYCFYGCTQLKNCGNLPERITSIGSHVFKGCTSFKNIDELPQTIESLGEECFCACTGITAVLYPPKSLETIGERCFADCTSLESFYIPSGVTKIGEEAFAGCTILSDVMSDAGDASDVPSIDETAFSGESPIIYVPSALLPKYQSHSVWGELTVKKYGVYEFVLSGISANTSLLPTTSRIVSDSIWTISYGVGDEQQRFIPSTDSLPLFTYKEDVSSATITMKGYIRRIAAASSESYPFLASITASPFTNLQSIEVKDSPLEMIGDYAFAQCDGLETIKCGLEEERDYCLGERAFWGCSKLKSTEWLKDGLGRLVKETQITYEEKDDGTIVPIETNVPYPAFGERCFWQSGITKLEYSKKDVTSLSAYCFAETKISSIDGLGEFSLKSLGEYCFYKCTNLRDISPLRGTSITVLPDYCFAECDSLASIEGVDGLISDGMGSHVFENSSVASIVPLKDAEGITAIAPYMFAGCSLETLYGLTKKVVELGEGCFSTNEKLKDISGLLESSSITSIPNRCFQGSGLLCLIGCWNITSIGDYAFSGCTGMISTSGLGPNISSIGAYAFQNCTALKQASCIASNVPTIASTSFSGAPTSSIPLYVKEDMVSTFQAATTWRNFASIGSRTIKVHLQDVGGDGIGDVSISSEDAQKTGVLASIDPNGDEGIGIWYVDYGDGTPFEHFYSTNKSVYDALTEHDFKTRVTNADGEEELVSTRGNYTVTLFGDIIELWGSHDESILEGSYQHDAPEKMDVAPFLGSLSKKASSVSINSPYLKKIGDFCFFNYGQAPIPGNDNALSVSVTMNGAGTVGAYAFAKKDEKDETYGPIGTLGAFNAVTVGNYAFYHGGLNSSTPFNTITTAGTAAFAKNTLLTELAGFSSLTEVTESLFEGCTGLITTSGLSAVTEIQHHGFKDCTGLTSVKDFSASFAKIGAGAFNNCPNITRIFMANVNPPYLAQDGFDGVGNEFLPNALVYVPAGRESAYKEQEYWYKFQTESEGTIQWRITSRAITFVLQNVTKGLQIPANSFIVSATGNWTLDFGEGEEKRQYTTATKEIDTYTFNSASDLKEVKISGPVTSIQCTSSAYPIFGKEAGGKLLTSVSISEAMDITEIGNYLFRECKALESVKDADTVVSVGEYAFADAQKLWDITGLSNISSIDRYAFAGCSSLTSLYGLHRVTTIGERAFNGCSSLKTIDGLGTGVTSIGEYAFASCGKLKEVQMFAEEPPTMPTTAFSGLSSEVPLYVRTKCLTAYKESSSWGSVFGDIRSRFVEFTLTACPSNLTVKGNIGKVKSDTFWAVDWDAYDSDGVPSEDGAEEQYLPQHTYSLSGNHTMRIEGAVTFIGCSKPTVNAIHDPYEVEGETIVPSREDAISGTSFLTLEHDGSILDGDAHLLTRVSRSSYSVLSEVGPSAFLRNKNLSAAYLSGISSIGIAAFAYDTSLDNLALLDTVGSIGKYAFYGCSGLTSIVGLNGQPDSDGNLSFSIADYAFGDIPNLTYIQVGVPLAKNAKITNLSFGVLDIVDGKYNVSVYVPLESVMYYADNDQWGKFKIASQVLTFTMMNVPSGTTILGRSETNPAGVARIESSSRWTIDWDDGSMNTMEKGYTSFPSHTYIFDENANPLEKARWVEGADGIMYRSRIDISITGVITTLACQSSSNYPFLATEIGHGNPYLTSVSAPQNMDTLTTIGDYVFKDCASLESVTGFCYVESIGQYAFSGCTALANIGDSDSGFKICTSVGNKSFADCQSLSNMSSFASLVSIGIRAFENCISLTGTTGMGSKYSLWTQSDWKNNRLVATFGAYAFEGCGFGAIDMDNYAVPPTIQTTTFPGNPEDVIVFVSSKEGVLELYKATSVWVRYFENIIAASNIAITFEDSISIATVKTENVQTNVDPDDEKSEKISIGQTTTTTGMAFYGEGARLDFKGAYLLIDWGDGETTTRLNESGEDVKGWTLPNHPYKNLKSSTVTINIKGEISKIYPASSGDAPLAGGTPDDTMLPCIGIVPFEEVVSTVGNAQNTTYDKDNVRYDARVSIAFGAGSKLSKIGSYSFQGCNISSLYFGKPAGEGTIEIGDCAFRNCSTSSLNIGFSNGTSDGESSLPPTSTENSIGAIGAYAFAGCSQLNTTKFISGATAIGEYAFLRDTNLIDTEGLTKVKYIGVGAFKGCIGITSIKLPQSLLSVATSAFEGCSGTIGGIEWEQAPDDSDFLSDGDITIGDRAFYGCTGSNNKEWSITIPSQVHTIGESAFSKCGMQKFTWNGKGKGTFDELTTTGAAGTFEGCENLQTVTIEKSIGAIPARAFCMDKNLQTVSIAGTRTSIGNYAFFGCESLGEGSDNASFANICNGLKAPIGDYAFARCLNLGAITIPESVTALGEGCFSCSPIAFYKGEWDENITYTATEPPTFNTLTQFEQWMTDTYGGKRLDVWGEYDKILTKDTESDNIAQLSVSWPFSGSNPPTRTIGKGCFMNYRNIVIAWSGFQSITLVPEYCFFNCQSLFKGTNLSALPATITYFGRFALARTGMSEIGRSKIDDTTGDITRGKPIAANLAPALFLGCSSLGTLGTIKGEDESEFVDGLKSLFSTIPSAIPDGCFYRCSSLSDINTLSTDVTNIKRLGQYCFSYCTSLSGRGTYNISNALSEITQIDDGCFLNCIGLKGEFKGLPQVSYYPYLSFYGCSGISEIVQFCTQSVSESESVTLEGDSFGGIVSLDKINLPYSTMVNIVGANGINDPFSGIPYTEDGKRDAVIVIPNELLSEYMSDDYWGKFSISTSLEGLTPCMVITMSVPSEGGFIRGFGRIEIDTSESDRLLFTWGDGTVSSFTVVGGVLDLSSISHEYKFGLPAGEVDQNITLSIYGNIKSVSGDADNETSSVLANKTVVPFLYTDVTEYQSGQTVPRLAVNTWFRSITFSTSTLEKIGDGAFGYCTEMAEPFIPLSVKELGNNAFFGCDKITSLDMIPVGSAISKIGQYCFAYCDNLTDYSGFKRLTSLEAVPNGCFAKTKSVIPGTEQKLDWLPDSIKSIGFAAFQHVCFSYFDLQTTTPITVGNYAFRYNNSLRDFTNGNNESGIYLNLTGTNVFRDCKALESLDGLKLSSTNTAIPTGTFRGCSALIDISNIPTTITSIGDASFYGTAVYDLSQLLNKVDDNNVKMSSIDTIGSNSPYDKDFEKDLGGAFEGCGSLKSLDGMPTSITKIGTAAFKDCPLGDLTGMSPNVTKIGPYCFYGCTMMEDLDGLSTGVSALPDGGFGNCPGLTSILIPSTVTTIGKTCFAGSSNLNRITLQRISVTNIEDNPASDASWNCFPYGTLSAKEGFHIYVPASTKSDYELLWCAENRFGTRNAETGAWVPFSLDSILE